MGRHFKHSDILYAVVWLRIPVKRRHVLHDCILGKLHISLCTVAVTSRVVRVVVFLGSIGVRDFCQEKVSTHSFRSNGRRIDDGSRYWLGYVLQTSITILFERCRILFLKATVHRIVHRVSIYCHV